MQHTSWRTEAGGVVTAEAGPLRLVVKEVGGLMRFLVLRPWAAAGQDALLGSGTGSDARAAMAGAERMASRVMALPGGRIIPAAAWSGEPR